MAPTKDAQAVHLLRKFADDIEAGETTVDDFVFETPVRQRRPRQGDDPTYTYHEHTGERILTVKVKPVEVEAVDA